MLALLPMLQLKNLNKSFNEKVIDNLTLAIPSGQVFGFLGPNGAGKTTTVKMIVGLLFPDSGSIKLDKLPAGSLAAKRLTGFMPESPQFYSHLSAKEVLEFVGTIFGLERPLLADRTKTLLQKVGLADSAKLSVRQFSKGMLQRLSFAVALINEPKLLVLDEPLDGLDPLGRLDFKKLLLNLKKTGVTIFLSSHILADVAEICDSVSIINRGRILKSGTPKALTGSRFVSLEEMFVETIRQDG